MYVCAVKNTVRTCDILATPHPPPPPHHKPCIATPRHGTEGGGVGEGCSKGRSLGPARQLWGRQAVRTGRAGKARTGRAGRAMTGMVRRAGAGRVGGGRACWINVPVGGGGEGGPPFQRFRWDSVPAILELSGYLDTRSAQILFPTLLQTSW
jgi:hypothetical protein